MAPVEIYTTPYCPYCIDAKALLKKKNVAFTEIDVSRDRDLRTQDDRSAPTAATTVPQIFIGATHVGGCDDLYALEGEGKLDPLLNGQVDAHDRLHLPRRTDPDAGRAARRRPISTPPPS